VPGWAKSSKIISRQKGREPTLRCQTPHLYLHAHAIVSQKGAQKQLQILISRAILLACLSGLRRSLPIFVRGESALWLRIWAKGRRKTAWRSLGCGAPQSETLHPRLYGRDLFQLIPHSQHPELGENNSNNKSVSQYRAVRETHDSFDEFLSVSAEKWWGRYIHYVWKSGHLKATLNWIGSCVTFRTLHRLWSIYLTWLPLDDSLFRHGCKLVYDDWARLVGVYGLFEAGRPIYMPWYDRLWTAFRFITQIESPKWEYLRIIREIFCCNVLWRAIG
jgi:hypothetical protein